MQRCQDAWSSHGKNRSLMEKSGWWCVHVHPYLFVPCRHRHARFEPATRACAPVLLIKLYPRPFSLTVCFTVARVAMGVSRLSSICLDLRVSSFPVCMDDSESCAPGVDRMAETAITIGTDEQPHTVETSADSRRRCLHDVREGPVCGVGRIGPY